MKSFVALLFALIVVLLTGCSLHSIPADYSLQKEKESIVFGSLSYPESGIPLISKPINKANGVFGIHTVIAREQRMYGVVPELINNVYYFYITLPQGRYCINEVTWGELKYSVNAMFNVYENGKIYYIGHLAMSQIERSPGELAFHILMRGFTGGGALPIQGTVIDGNQKESDAFFKRYPHLPRDVEKSLMYFKR